MLLRILASGAVFLVVVTLATIAAVIWLDDFTLYSTRDGWAGNAASVGGVVATLLGSGLISVGYFRSYSSAELRYQPYANIVVILLAVAVIFQVERGGEEASPQMVEIVVFPDVYRIEGYTGSDVVAVLAEVMASSNSREKQLVLSASSEVEYRRLQDTLQRLHGAGYTNIGLLTELRDER